MHGNLEPENKVFNDLTPEAAKVIVEQDPIKVHIDALGSLIERQGGHVDYVRFTISSGKESKYNIIDKGRKINRIRKKKLIKLHLNNKSLLMESPEGTRRRRLMLMSMTVREKVLQVQRAILNYTSTILNHLVDMILTQHKIFLSKLFHLILEM